MRNKYKSERVKRSREMRPSAALAAVVLMLAVGTLNAQQHSVALRGLVFDSATGQALSNVAIHVNQSTLPVRTDTLGEFLLTDLSIGSYTLTLAIMGYGPKVFTVSLNEDQRDTVEVGPFPLARAGTITAAVSGSVLDSRTDEPVTGVGISVNGAVAAHSGERGFTTGRLNVLPGLNTVEFNRIGYEPLTLALWALRNHTDFDLAVPLDPLAVQIPMVVVEADQTTYVFGTLREFYRRRRTGLGHYYTQQDIEEQHPLNTSDMLRMTPGIVVRPGRYGGNTIGVIGYRGMNASCSSMNIYIDGHLVSTDGSDELDALIHPDNVAAIEVYPRPAQIPVQFKTRGAVCGVIAVWTRR